MSKPTVQPPALADRFLNWFCADEVIETLQGDLYELYVHRLEKKGKIRADVHYYIDVLDVCRPFAWKRRTGTFTNHQAMFQHNFKLAFRNLLKNGAFTLINVGGLAVGIMVPLLIGLWIYDELSFDQQFHNADRIAKILQNQDLNGKIETWENQAMQLEPELRNKYGKHFKYITTSRGIWEQLLTFEDRKLSRSGGFFGPDIAQMLSLNMLEGSREALHEPNVVLLAASTAKALFGDRSPMDKTISINNDLEVTIKGVYEDLPINSSFGNLGFIAPFELHVESRNLRERTDWGNSWFMVYVEIADQADMDEVSSLIRKVKYHNIDEELARKTNPELFLHSMNRWYLYGKFENGVSRGGRIENVLLFGTIATFILLLACINFMNLSTARSERRVREVGIRKALGSMRGQLIGQFYSESVVISGLAFLLSLLLSVVLLPAFNVVADKQLTMPWSEVEFWVVSIGFVLITGLVAGSYPAFYLSAFQPVKAFNRTANLGRYASMPRKVLVVVQFTVSISLIVATIFVYQQIQYAQDRPTGYNRDSLVRVPAQNREVQTRFQAFRNDLLNTGLIEEAAATDTRITATTNTHGNFDWEGKDPNRSNDFTGLRITQEFGEMVDWEILEGRDFSRDLATDEKAFILNEAAVEYMGLKDPVGKVMRRDGNIYPIIGVVRNLVTQSPYDPVRQTIFMLEEDWFSHIYIKLKPEKDTKEALAQIESIYGKYDPFSPFEYDFADENYARKFQNEERIGKLAFFFAVLAIFISCLGLFGLSSYVAEQRAKEIGIRKVLGASVYNLWEMLSKDFLYLVIISCILATPISYYLVNDWLQNYNYRTELSWWVFALAGLLAILITLGTVSFQALRAALSNPVRVIRPQ